MAEKINIYQKLQTCRVGLAKKNLKKSGLNKHSGYKYYELGDFLPAINELNSENGLMAIFHPGVKELGFATLTIINIENIEETLTFYSEIASAKLSGCQDIQNVGAAQTYQRRYLYVQAYEIAEGDMIEPATGQKAEKTEVEEIEEAEKQIIDANKVKSIRSLLAKSKSDENQFLDFYHLDSLEEMTNKEYMRGMRSLEKKIRELGAEGKPEEKEDLGL
jgi:hypothetical protein